MPATTLCCFNQKVSNISQAPNNGVFGHQKRPYFGQEDIIWSDVIIGDELTCVSIHSILPLLSLNNNTNPNPGHNMDIRLEYNNIHSHTNKPRCISGSLLHEISKFYTCYYGCTHAVHEIR